MTTSPFRIRGVIEGFYGRPWTHDQRLRLIDFLAARGMNTFVYAPKDDPLVRRDWRRAYDGPALGQLTEMVERCRAVGMQLVWCISPGLSIRYSDPDDLARLVQKLRSVSALGVRRLGLLLDDIPPDLQHPEDRDAFPDLVHAQVALIGRVLSSMPAGVGLIVCPTLYWGTGAEPYLAALGGSLDPRIDLLWTGRAVCSPTLDLVDACTFTRTANRPPTYWDNYPVNDVGMSYELHIGPYRGRDPFLWRSATGIVANGMELFEASLIPIATIADYLRDPVGYDPERSWQQAMRDVVGEADLEPFALFADNVRSSCLAAEDAPTVTRVLTSTRSLIERGETSPAAAGLGELADRLLAAAAHLLRRPVNARDLIEEVRPWLDAFELGAQAMRRMADLIAAGRLGSDGPTELRPFLIRLRRARVRVFGDALEMALSDVTGTLFRPGEVPQWEGGVR
jgi:hyaluronoglucosaminidase